MPNKGTTLAFWEKFADEVNNITSILYKRERKKFLRHFLLQLMAEIQKHIDTRPSQRVDKSIIGQIYFNDFFFEQGHVIIIEEALERVPDAVFALPGSGGLQ